MLCSESRTHCIKTQIFIWTLLWVSCGKTSPKPSPKKTSLMDANGSLGAEAHTCFNQLLRCSQGRVLLQVSAIFVGDSSNQRRDVRARLDLPDYPSEEVLREKLLQAAVSWKVESAAKRWWFFTWLQQQTWCTWDIYFFFHGDCMGL